MGTALFYHLTRRSQDETAAMLLEKALGAGWRVAVRGTDRARLEALDGRLWQGAEDSFLPHGLAGGAHDEMQPVLLTMDAVAPNAPQCVMSVDGAQVTAGDVALMERVFVLFDGNDAAALNTARGQWKALKQAGAAAQYWSEESGRWQKKAET